MQQHEYAVRPALLQYTPGSNEVHALADCRRTFTACSRSCCMKQEKSLARPRNTAHALVTVASTNCAAISPPPDLQTSCWDWLLSALSDDKMPGGVALCLAMVRERQNGHRNLRRACPETWSVRCWNAARDMHGVQTCSYPLTSLLGLQEAPFQGKFCISTSSSSGLQRA